MKGSDQTYRSRGLGSFSRLREKAGDEGAGRHPYPIPVPQAGEGAGHSGIAAKCDGPLP
jgi:hypothetical protein